MRELPLAEIAEVQTGYPFRTKVESDPDGDLFVIQGKDVFPDRPLDPDGLMRIRLKSGARPGKNLLRRNDIIFMTRSELPYAVHIAYDPPPTVVQNSFSVVRLRRDDLILPAFLAMILNQSLMRARVAEIIKGTNIPYVRVSDLRSVPIPLPPLERQRTLVKLERALHCERALHRELEAARQQQLDAMILREEINHPPLQNE